ncbi:CDP-glycerol glycerophosphotransferase family protein [uncultured Anaerofustis sp.]|uniref:CDP-glycerol glycerophosphotransferase family protein n=1 Tax=uncultured Anaerofustis sp. TaxID=904996 RepID=UPI0025ECBE2D|nr:CDP-glycerol glycerophosphotransferase family protein [uncultured Anaerofustis sp.]
MNKLEYTLSNIFLHFFYYLFYLIPVNNRKITFSTPRNTKPDGNIKYIYRALRDKRDDLKFVFLFDKYDYSLKGKILYLLRLVKGVYHLATSRVFIVDNAYFPVHVIKHKKRTVVIQVWHAAGAMKKFGNDVEIEEEAVEDKFRHKNYDYCIMGSDFSKKHYATAFGMDEEKVLVLGSARTDLFFKEDVLNRVRNEFYEKYPDLKSKKIILYAPTFRGRGNEKDTKLHLNVEKMKKELEGLGYVFLYKPHLNAKSEDNKDDDFIKYLDKEDVLNKVMPVCDIFITDYSSAVIEYSILKKPLILYVYDLEEYIDSPGFYQDFKTEMIGEQVKKTDDVIKIIKENDFDLSGYDKFINTHYKYLDGNSSDRIADYIIKNFIDKK